MLGVDIGLCCNGFRLHGRVAPAHESFKIIRKGKEFRFTFCERDQETQRMRSMLGLGQRLASRLPFLSNIPMARARCAVAGQDTLQWLASLPADERTAALGRVTDPMERELYTDALHDLGGGDLIPFHTESVPLPTVRWTITPNEQSRKFFPGCAMRGPNEQFRSPADASHSPLAGQLFLLPGVTRWVPIRHMHTCASERATDNIV